MDGLRVLGEVLDFAKQYYRQGADEILMLDAVATLHGKDNIAKIVSKLTVDCFVPITVGGGVRELRDADQLFEAGADKVSLNSAAIENPSLISRIAEKYGSQAVVVHIEAKSKNEYWECYTQSGREPSGYKVPDWITIAQDSGAGEFLISSVDKDGTQRGQDLELIQLCSTVSSIPVIAASGVGKIEDVVSTFKSAEVEGVAIATALHKQNFTLKLLKETCVNQNIDVRIEDLF